MNNWETLLLMLAYVAYGGATVGFSLRYWIRRQELVLYSLALTGIALFFHTALLLLRGIASGHLPFSNLYEFTLVFAWSTLLLFAYCAKRFRLLAAAPLVLSLVTLLTGMAYMMPRDIRPLMPALRSVWLQIHVATGILAYGALAISAVLSVVMLTASSKSDESAASHLTDKYWRTPSIDEMGRYIHGLIVFGFVFLSILIVTGAVWAEATWGRWWGWDPKETWALITWLIYLAYLHGKARFGWRSRPMAWFAAVGFLAVMFTLFGVTYLLPGLHSYK